MKREVNLIGGFYKDNSLTFSAQDTVNWLPVPDESSGARSPIKLRGLPGLKALTPSEIPIPPGDWIIFWTVGAGNVAYFLTTSDPLALNMATGQLLGVSETFSGTAFAFDSLFVSNSARALFRATDKDGPFSALTLQVNGPTSAGRVAQSGTNVVYGGASGEAQYSSNGGTTWIRSTGSSVEWVAANTAGNLVGFTGITPQCRTSSNNGVSFGLGGTPSFPSYNVFGGVTSDTSTFVVVVSATAGGLYASRSTDNGASWSSGVLLPIADTARDSPIVGNSVLSPSPGTFYVMSSQGMFVRSTDSGATWQTSVDTGLSLVRGWAVGNGLIVATGQSSAPNEGVSVSADGGATWTLSTVTNAPPDFDFDSAAFFPRNP